MDPNISLKQQQKFNFSFHSRKFKTRKILFFGRFAKVYAREVQKFREFFGSRKFQLLK